MASGDPMCPMCGGYLANLGPNHAMHCGRGFVGPAPIISPFMSGSLVSDGMVCVARGLLETCLGVIEEAKKNLCPTASNFDDDVELCIGQLEAHLK